MGADFKDVIAQVIQLYYAPDREQLLFRVITDQQWSLIESRVDRLFSHKIWDNPNPEVASQLKLNLVEQVRNFLTARHLTVNWILGGEGA